jgi:ParB family chromosome partitioning protein
MNKHTKKAAPKAKASRGLGMGLGALMAASESEYRQTRDVQEKNEEPTSISIKEIVANPYQPRKVFDKELLAELAASIKEHGIIQPLIVRKKEQHYELVAGERRLRAAQLAKLTEVPVLLRDYSDEQMMEIALVENIQRHNLNPIEEAEGIKKLMEACHLTQEQAAEKVGRSRVAVTNMLRLLNLPKSIQEDVSRETLTMGQVKPLLTLDKEADQLRVARFTKDSGWNSRYVEKIVQLIKSGKPFKYSQNLVTTLMDKRKEQGKTPVSEKAPVLSAEYQTVQENLVSYLGTRVKVVPKNKEQGKIEITYTSVEDLNRIYELLQGPEKATMPVGLGKARKLTV